MIRTEIRYRFDSREEAEGFLDFGEKRFLYFFREFDKRYVCLYDKEDNGRSCIGQLQWKNPPFTVPGLSVWIDKLDDLVKEYMASVPVTEETPETEPPTESGV